MVSSVISAIENCGVRVRNNDSLLIECNCLDNASDMMGQSKSTLVEQMTLLRTECGSWVFFPSRFECAEEGIPSIL